ncbi:Ethanolamine ammonia-lyase light chain [Solimonas aquatica]|uniref:Ethanolamine ammonia-lyase small subunit n=1 Tax=Solimonas aquatica TaxID=489703 RepID=A0A1H9EWQ2_9GAMM|nr:ethanolamine ammonia-lyase subunit EutC [Solimonas aquatica]SEQ30049.1 Ethanolamine ammonia-lyase light chain [Solimonas aquatica]
MSGITHDPFARFRGLTRARIGIGRAGDAQPTNALLDFQAAHSRARDAVHGAVDFHALAAQLAHPSVPVRSRAPDRQTYLRRPDLGRRLHEEDVSRLQALAGDFDLAIVVADGLSAAAVSAQVPGLLAALLPRLDGMRLAPIALAAQGRVALGDEIAELLGARMVAVLIGERPGLSVADSLGIYLTWQPRLGRVDAERNCISNVHGDGLSHAQAAETLLWLMNEARERQLTGVDLKLETPTVSLPSAPQALT